MAAGLAGSALGAASGIAGAVGAVAGAVTEGERLAEQSNDRVAGVNQERAETNAAAAKVNENVAQDLATDTDVAALARMRRGGA